MANGKEVAFAFNLLDATISVVETEQSAQVQDFLEPKRARIPVGIKINHCGNFSSMAGPAKHSATRMKTNPKPIHIAPTNRVIGDRE